VAELDLQKIVRTTRINLRRRMARRPVAFVMSGGGSQGSFEAGVLRFLYDDVGLRPSILVGSSVGAIIAAKLAEGDDEENGRRAIDEVEAIWRGLRTNADMWVMEPWLEKLRSQVTWASALRGRAGAGAQSVESNQARVILRLVGELVRNPPQTDGTIDALRAALKARSLVSMEPIRELVERELRPERIAGSGMTLRIGAVSLESGELRYVDGDGQLYERDGTPLDRPKVRVQDAVLASASIPVMYPPTELGGEYYVDGGVREILPLALAFNQLGAGHIFAVVASKPGVEPWHDSGDRGLFELARRVSVDIAPDETLRKEIDPPRGWGRRVTVIVPQVDVHDSLTIDPELIAAAIDYGYMRAADVILELDDDEAELSAEIARARMRLRAAKGPVAGLLQEELPDMGAVVADAAEEHATLCELVERRRASGAPMPPGPCGTEVDV
jgi:predicted acylesterase/phospholipase RssA